MILPLSQDFFYKTTLGLALIILLISSWNAPMSGDEYVHEKQAEKNINYIKTLGEDKTALDTPISRLKHYGQSFDTITTFFAQVLSIKDIYRFRHISSAIMAWLVILFTSLLSIRISKNKFAGIIAVLLFLVTGRFMGHAMNNLKDIPFAFSYIFSLYFLFRFIVKLPKISWFDLSLLTLGIAFGISIRIGGLLIFALFILFTALYIYYLSVSGLLKRNESASLIWKFIPISISVVLISCFIGFLIWPFALENMLVNPWESLALMQDYPTTVRQIFEGKLYWSDQFPWYYLFKYLLITLPIIVLIGLVAFFAFIKKLNNTESIVLSIFTLISFGFPLFYAASTGANVYGGWRQMLFTFPPLIVLSSTGIWIFFEKTKHNIYLKTGTIILFLGLLLNPIRFIVANYPYQYTFFNVLVGGTKGAYGNYELDYYFTSYKKAYEYIDSYDPQASIVAANFIIPEYYKGKNYKPALIDYYNRSASDWNYAVVCNTFLSPNSLKSGLWPPKNTIYKEEVDGVPILAILNREENIDFKGVENLTAGNYSESVEMLSQALELDENNESILMNLARAYFLNDQTDRALTAIDRLLILYPNHEWAIDLKGEINMKSGKQSEAITLFKTNIENNYKFFHSYVNLAEAFIENGQPDEAVSYLKACLRVNPFYEPAYKVYGRLLIDQGEVELGEKMLQFSIEGTSKYGNR